jgi:tetratricopeptide (TPR) repeat protein
VSRHDEAIDNYVRAIELHPDYLEASSKLGAALLRVGRCEQAARWFAHAVEINDRLLDTYTGLALARKDLGNEHEAASAMRMAAGIEPNSPLLFSEVIRLRGASCADRSHKHEGGSASAEGSTFRSARSADDWLTKEIQAYQRHLRQRSNHTQWHYELGLLLRQRGELDEAIAHYRQALLINPAYTKAWVQLALILHQQGRSAEAFEAVDCGSNPGTELIWLHYQLSLSFTLPMRFDLSLEAVEQSRDTVAPNADTQANIRLALETVGLLDPIGVGPMGAETT